MKLTPKEDRVLRVEATRPELFSTYTTKINAKAGRETFVEMQVLPRAVVGSETVLVSVMRQDGGVFSTFQITMNFTSPEGKAK